MKRYSKGYVAGSMAILGAIMVSAAAGHLQPGTANTGNFLKQAALRLGNFLKTGLDNYAGQFVDGRVRLQEGLNKVGIGSDFTVVKLESRPSLAGPDDGVYTIADRKNSPVATIYVEASSAPVSGGKVPLIVRPLEGKAVSPGFQPLKNLKGTFDTGTGRFNLNAGASRNSALTP